MGSEFLLLITLERAFSLLLSAVLDTVNLMGILYFCFVRIAYWSTKIQNYLFNRKNICRKLRFLKLFSVISQPKTENLEKK